MSIEDIANLEKEGARGMKKEVDNEIPRWMLIAGIIICVLFLILFFLMRLGIFREEFRRQSH